MADENKLGEKLGAAGSAATNEWAAKRDRALLEKLRRDLDERTAKERKPRSFNRILCAIDFEFNSLNALAFAKQIASENDAELYVIHVCPTISIPLTTTSAAEAAARGRLQEVAARQLGGVSHELLVTTGDAAERVATAQSALGADLIVMGTHGRRGVPRFFLGSVAGRVVRTASCPVLTLRGE